MLWSQLTNIKNFTIIILYINLRANIRKIWKTIFLQNYPVKNDTQEIKYACKNLILNFWSLWRFPTLQFFQDYRCHKYWAWGWRRSSAGLRRQVYTLAAHNHRKGAQWSSSHQSLHCSPPSHSCPLSMRKSSQRPKSHSDDSEGQYQMRHAIKDNYTTIFLLTPTCPQVPKTSRCSNFYKI